MEAFSLEKCIVAVGLETEAAGENQGPALWELSSLVTVQPGPEDPNRLIRRPPMSAFVITLGLLFACLFMVLHHLPDARTPCVTKRQYAQTIRDGSLAKAE